MVKISPGVLGATMLKREVGLVVPMPMFPDLGIRRRLVPEEDAMSNSTSEL